MQIICSKQKHTGWSKKKNESKIRIQKKITFHAFVFELSNHFPKILQSLGAKEKKEEDIRISVSLVDFDLFKNVKKLTSQNL